MAASDRVFRETEALRWSGTKSDLTNTAIKRKWNFLLVNSRPSAYSALDVSDVLPACWDWECWKTCGDLRGKCCFSGSDVGVYFKFHPKRPSARYVTVQTYTIRCTAEPSGDFKHVDFIALLLLHLCSAKFNSAFQHLQHFVRCFGRSAAPLIPRVSKPNASEYVCFGHYWILWILTSIWWSDSLIECNTPDWTSIPFDYLTAEWFFNSHSAK